MPPPRAAAPAVRSRHPAALPEPAEAARTAGGAHPPTRGRRVGRATSRAALTLFLVLIAGLWTAMRPPASPAAPAPPVPEWRLDVRADRGATPWVLVFGREAGLHVVRAPEAGRLAALPARVPGRAVRMVSLGRAPLDVRGDAAGAGGLLGFSARGRVVTVFRDRSGTGVRTGF